MMKSDVIQSIQLLCLHHVSFCATAFAFCCALFTSVVTLSCIGVCLAFKGKNIVHSAGSCALHSGQDSLLYTSLGVSTLITPLPTQTHSNANIVYIIECTKNANRGISATSK